MDYQIDKFLSGIHNLADDEIIPKDSAQDAQNWFTEDGRLILSYGRNLIGQEGGVGKIYGEHFGYKVDGTKVHYRKIGTKIQYLKDYSYSLHNYSLSLDGVDDYLKTDSTSLLGSQKISFSFWVKDENDWDAIGTSNPRHIFSQKSSTYVLFATLMKTSGDKLTLEVYSSGDGFTISNFDLDYFSVFRNMVLTIDPTTGIWKFYIDGVLIYTKTSSTFTRDIGNRSIYFGCRENPTNTGFEQFFTGKLSDIRVFDDYILSDKEVQEIFVNTSTLTNYQFYYKLDEGSGLVANDSSINNNDGTISGGTWSSDIVSNSGSFWLDIITGLSAIDCTFANYSSLAGSFTFVGSHDGLWKIINANPASPISMYDAMKNFKGKILIDRGRMLLWDRNDTQIDKTGLYGSWIDKQNSTVYTTVSGEVIADVSSGTLAFKSGGATRSCFGVVITDTSSGEVFTDNYLGVLVGSLGNSGTINYATGAFTITGQSGAGTATYKWENSNAKGVTDFTLSATRVAGEGFQFPQDQGGDAILNVLIGQDGAYYSLKSQSCYKLTLEETDLAATNEVYRTDIGIPFFRACASTQKGIVFINTANPSRPELTILQRNPLGNNIEPVPLFPHFKFSDFNYDDCVLDTWGQYIIIGCASNTINDRILICDISKGTVSISTYGTRTFAKDSGNLYCGSPVSENIYQLFNSFDDDSLTIDNYWIGRGETYDSELLKKLRRLRLNGLIQPSQKCEVYLDYDDSGFELIGTILGNGGYVDIGTPIDVGSNMIGDSQIGGNENNVVAYPFFIELKTITPKFRKITIKLVATSIGYLEFRGFIHRDILPFENRIPKRFRQKQNVSLDGTLDNQ